MPAADDTDGIAVRRSGGARPGWRKIADVLLFLVLAGGAVLIVRSFGSSVVFSSVKVVDGDSLRDGAEDIRLHGIDAPEYRQTCRDRAGQPYDCGKRAARYLRKLIGNSAVECQVIDTDRYGRTVGVCSANGIELNAAMIEAGWAVAYTRHSLSYSGKEGGAKRSRRGIWQGTFEHPEDWRQANRSGIIESGMLPD